MTEVASFSTESEAFIACGMLIDNGIDAFVETNNMATLYGAGATWAPIRLLVPRYRLEAARRLLAAHND